jgi:hypothetical protein
MYERAANADADDDPCSLKGAKNGERRMMNEERVLGVVERIVALNRERG